MRVNVMRKINRTQPYLIELKIYVGENSLQHFISCSIKKIKVLVNLQWIWMHLLDSVKDMTLWHVCTSLAFISSYFWPHNCTISYKYKIKIAWMGRDNKKKIKINEYNKKKSCTHLDNLFILSHISLTSP